MGDARVRLLVALAGVVVSLALPGAGFAVGAVALAALIVRRPRRLPRALAGVALAAGPMVAIAAWLDGPGAAAALGARALGASASGLWLALGTDPHAIALGLLRLGVPEALVEQLRLAARYVALLSDTLVTARDAQALRLGHVGLARRVRSTGILAGLVLGRAVDRAAQIADARALRGAP